MNSSAINGSIEPIMSSADPTTTFFQAVAAWFEESRPLMPMFLHIILSVLFPIYIGAHASLSRPPSAAKPTRESLKEAGDEDEDEDDEKDRKMEGLTAMDAIIFPLTAGSILAGLYFIITNYGAEMINLIMGYYFAAIGIFSVAKLLTDSITVIASFVFPSFYYDAGQVWKIAAGERKAVVLGDAKDSNAERRSPLPGFLGRLPLPGFVQSSIWTVREKTLQRYAVKGFCKGLFDFKTIMTRLDLLSAGLSIVTIAYSILVSTPWWLTNLQGFAVCYGALQLMSPTSFTTGTLILTGLFFYDIWAVFFTPLMVTVAKNLDVPIKLVFPRPDEPSSVPDEPPIKTYSMLGLGDIVLPGIMIALALRFDLYMFYLKKQKKVEDKNSEKKQAEVEKAPYVPVSRHWGEKIWTAGATSSLLPVTLRTDFPKTYFLTSTTGYLIGLITTLVVMTVWQHAQPALLYLVPGVLISLWVTGLLRGELKQMWNFTEEINAEQKDEDATNVNKDHSGQGKEETSKSTPINDSANDKPSGQTNAEKTRKPTSEDKAKAIGSQNERLIFSLSIQRQSLPKVKSDSKT